MLNVEHGGLNIGLQVSLVELSRAHTNPFTTLRWQWESRRRGKAKVFPRFQATEIVALLPLDVSTILTQL